MPQFLILPPWYLVLYKKKKSKDRGGAGDMAQGVRVLVQETQIQLPSTHTVVHNPP